MPRKTVVEEVQVQVNEEAQAENLYLENYDGDIQPGDTEQLASEGFWLQPFDGLVEVTWDTPKSLWGAFGHVQMKIQVGVDGPVDLVGIYLRALSIGQAALARAKEHFADYLDEYYASLPSAREAAEAEAAQPRVEVVPQLSGLSPEQAREFARLAPNLPGKGGVVAKFLQTAKSAGIYMKKASPEDAERFMEYARALAAGENPKPPGKASPARRIAQAAARGRRQNPFA